MSPVKGRTGRLAKARASCEAVLYQVAIRLPPSVFVLARTSDCAARLIIGKLDVGLRRDLTNDGRWNAIIDSSAS
jgi:hypothetical protein